MNNILRKKKKYFTNKTFLVQFSIIILNSAIFVITQISKQKRLKYINKTIYLVF